jgi:hypothetical protein
MESKASIFERIYRDYLKRVSQLDLRSVAQEVGAEYSGANVIVPLFGEPHRISKTRILGPTGEEPSHSVKVVLCQYLLLHPKGEPEDDTWVSYKDFRDGAPFADAFHKNAEAAIAKKFTGKLGALKESCLCLGGYDPGAGWAYHLVMRFDVLPKLPILLLFNDADEEFPANCLLLFERRAEQYLDMECLAVLGWLLAEGLGQNVP